MIYPRGVRSRTATQPQFRGEYDATHYYTETVDAAGDLLIVASGGHVSVGAVSSLPASARDFNVRGPLTVARFESDTAIVDSSIIELYATALPAGKYLSTSLRSDTGTQSDKIYGSYGVLLVSKTGGAEKGALVFHAAVGTGFTDEVARINWDGVVTVTGHVTSTRAGGNVIRNVTADGADNQTFDLAGGGASGDPTRGSYIRVEGNEATGAGRVTLVAGNVTGGKIRLVTGNALERWTVDELGDLIATGTRPIRASGTDKLSLLGGTNGAVLAVNTADAADNGFVRIIGGGDSGNTYDRGGSIIAYGNEHAGVGRIDLIAGNIAGGVIDFYTGASVRRGGWSFAGVFDAVGNIVAGGNVTLGPAGTGATAAALTVEAGSGSGGDSYVTLRRNSVSKAIVGVAGAANNIITGAAADDLAVRAAQKILFSADGGTTLHGSVSNAGVWTLTSTLTGVLRADSGVVSVSAGVGVRSIFDHFTDANNGTTVETDLYSDTLAAARLATNGEKVAAQYGLALVGDATSTQRVRVYFGGTLVFDTGALSIGVTTSYMDLYVTVIRVSSSVVRVFVSSTSSFTALNATSGYVEVTGLTLANTQILKVTGTAAGATGGSNQITAKEGYVQWLPAAA